MVGKLSRFVMTAAAAFVMQAVVSTASVAQSAPQAWPTRPVRLILPFGPGSGADIAARLLTDKLQALWVSRWWSRANRAATGSSPSARL